MITEDHLGVCNEEPGVVAVRVGSEDVKPITLEPNSSTFGKVVYISF